MKVCPVCQTTDVHASHRRGWLERRPLTWVGILPFRCGACQTRYYRFALADARRRHGGLIVSHSERERPPRWRLQSRTRITVHQQGRTSLSVAGETENVSALGVRLRLPTEIAVGSKVELVVQSGAPRGGIVRWHTPDQTSGHVYGVEFDRPLERKAQALGRSAGCAVGG